MNLFNKDKDLIFKIANLILIIWLIGAITVFWMKVTDTIYPTRIPSYDEYKITYCVKNINYMETPEGEIIVECEDEYDNQISYLKEIRYENKKQLFILFGNIAILTGILYMLNRKKDKNGTV